MGQGCYHVTQRRGRGERRGLEAVPCPSQRRARDRIAPPVTVTATLRTPPWAHQPTPRRDRLDLRRRRWTQWISLHFRRQRRSPSFEAGQSTRTNRAAEPDSTVHPPMMCTAAMCTLARAAAAAAARRASPSLQARIRLRWRVREANARAMCACGKLACVHKGAVEQAGELGPRHGVRAMEELKALQPPHLHTTFMASHTSEAAKHATRSLVCT